MISPDHIVISQIDFGTLDILKTQQACPTLRLILRYNERTGRNIESSSL